MTVMVLGLGGAVSRDREVGGGRGVRDCVTCSTCPQTPTTSTRVIVAQCMGDAEPALGMHWATSTFHCYLLHPANRFTCNIRLIHSCLLGKSDIAGSNKLFLPHSLVIVRAHFSGHFVFEF